MKNYHHFTFGIIITFLLSSITVIAEDKFCLGYIITNKNDTLNGYIQQFNIDPYTKCNFKEGLSSKVISFIPGEIKAYRYSDGGKFFVSKQTPLEQGEKVLFLEYLIQGKANMYFMRDDMDHYFIETDKLKIIELSQRPILKQMEVENEGIFTFYKPEAYRGKLSYMLSDCSDEDFIREINNSKLKPDDLINLGKDYHNRVCNNEKCTIFERKIKPVKIHFSLTGGVSMNEFEFEDYYTNYHIGSTLGCKMEFDNILFSSEQLTFQLGVLFQNYSRYPIISKGELDMYGYPVSYNYPTNSIFSLNTIALNIPVTFNYTFIFGKIKPYVGIGVANLFTICNSKLTSSYVGVGVREKTFPFYRIGYIGMIGTKYELKNHHDLIFELSYTVNQEYYQIANYYNLVNKNFSFVVGYTI